MRNFVAFIEDRRAMQGVFAAGLYGRRDPREYGVLAQMLVTWIDAQTGTNTADNP